MKPRRGALLSSDDCGSSVERTATLHPLWQAQLSRPGVDSGDARWAAMQLMEGRYELMEDLSVRHVQPRGLGRPLMTRHPVVATRAVTAVQAPVHAAEEASGSWQQRCFDVESSYRIEPAIPSLPSMRRHFERPYQTSCNRTFAQANGAATSWFVGRREVGCSAVSGKSLARKLFRSPNTEGGLSRCST
jgi:hypothetical protein